MKTGVFIFLFALMGGYDYQQDPGSITKEVFIGVYDGLTEDLEFQFTSLNGKTYLFEEIVEDLDYDLYDEIWIEKTFKVSWEKRLIRILDEEDEPTGETREIKVIVALEKR